MRRIALAVTMGVLLSAGCLGDEAGGGGEQIDPASEPAASYGQVYAFDGEIRGDAPPHPTEEGSAIDGRPPARVETFSVPAGEGELDVDGQVAPGTGSARAEVYTPDGERVWASQYWIVSVGRPGSLHTGVYREEVGGSVEDPSAGEYEIRYYVGGWFGFDVEVTLHPP